MGVAGLLRILKPASQPRTLDDLDGLTLGVDGYGWLHRAVLTCAEDLVAGRPTTRYLEYIDRRVAQFERHNVKLYFVFDGAALPLKKRVNAQRAAARADAKTRFSQSGSHASRAVDVTPDMAACVCAYLRAKKISYVVAPYEADSQLVYLESAGLVNGILSEDSDLLVFGARRLFTKLDPAGTCVEVNSDCLAGTPLAPLAGPSQSALLRLLAVVSGCDYCAGIAGYGPVKAVALVIRHRSLDALVDAMHREGRSLDPDFVETARRADLAFQFQRVFEPTHRKLVTLRPVLAETPAEDIIGPELEAAVALQIARGVRCPETARQLAVPAHVTVFLGRIRAVPAVQVKPQAIERKVARVLGPKGAGVSPFFARPLKENVPPSHATPPATPSLPETPRMPLTQTPATKLNMRPADITPVPMHSFFTPRQTAKRAFSTSTAQLEPENEPELPTPRKIDFKRFAYGL